MTNINIDTDVLRRVLNGDEEAIKEAQSLLPASRTLADMAPVERAECEWMQCDHPALEEPGVILQIWANGCYVLSREGVVETEALNHVAPRPDLPRMEWPGNEPEEEPIDKPEDDSDFDREKSYRDREGAIWTYLSSQSGRGPGWYFQERKGGPHYGTFGAPILGPHEEVEKEEEVIIDPRDLLKSRQYLDSDGCVWGYRIYEGEDGPHWHWRLEGSSDWDPVWFSTPADGPWTEYRGQD